MYIRVNNGIVDIDSDQQSQITDSTSVSGIISDTIIAGERISQYQPFFISSVDGLAYKAYNKDTTSEADADGILIEDGGVSTGTSGVGAFIGVITNPLWDFTTKSIAYVGGMRGEIADIKPESGWIKELGIFISPNKLLLNPRTIYIESEYVPPNNEYYNMYSVCLDGVNDYISAPHSSSLDFGVDNFSISCWFKASESGSNIVQTLVSKIWDNISTTGNPGWALQLSSNGRIQMCMADDRNSNSIDPSEYTMSGVDYRDGMWHHVVVTIDRMTDLLLFYLDGILKSSHDISYWTTSFDTTYPLFIGANYNKGATPDGYFNGNIDEVALFDKVLSINEIIEVFGDGATSDLSNNINCIAWYRMGD